MKILIGWNISQKNLEIINEILKEIAEINYVKHRDEIEEKIKDIDVFIGGYLPDKIILAARKLRFIQTITAGVDRFNFNLLKEKNIVLASAKGCNAREVAVHALALLLALAKKIHTMDRELKKNRWIPWRPETMLEDLEGKIVGIIGYGRIGREIGRLCKALGMHVYAVKRTPSKPDNVAEFIGDVKSLDYVLTISDYVVLSLPLTPQTEGLIDEKRLRKMKKTAYLINVGRGAVVDEQALYKALTEKWIAGAGIDVWWEYPPSIYTPSRLGIHMLNNVIASSHKGGWTSHGREKCIRFAAENVKRFITGRKVLNVVDYNNLY